jgi:hypothetical protein
MNDTASAILSQDEGTLKEIGWIVGRDR